MRRASAHTPESDKFESASSPRKTSLLQAIMSCGPEKPDMYWSAPRAAERPVISVPEIGYVRRSEVIAQDSRWSRTGLIGQQLSRLCFDKRGVPHFVEL